MSTQALDLTPILTRLDALASQVSYLAERQRRTEELFEEMTPIAKAVMATATDKLDALDQKGYFEFGKELIGVGQRIVEAYGPDDVRQLGDAIVGILDTVRSLTQPDVLAIAADVSDAMHHTEDVKPLGMFGMVKATKNEDVQKGMAIMMEVLRRVGHGANELAARHTKNEDRKAKLAEILGPRRGRKLLGVERPRLPPGETEAAATPPRRPAKDTKVEKPTSRTGPACAVPAKPGARAAVIDGIAYTADGHMVDAGAWTEPLAEALAQVQGVALTDLHWAVISAARADFSATAASPNIRRLTQITKFTTKDLYTLFPKAPARTIAKVAGLPKPAGCL